MTSRRSVTSRRPVTLAMTAALLLGLPALSFAAERTFKQTYPLDDSGHVSLSNVNGDVTIEAWDKAEVSVEATISSRDQQAVDEVEIQVEATRNRLSIETEYPKNRGWRHQSASVEYRLRVPRKVRLSEISLVNGALQLDGVAGEVEASLVNGNLTAKGLAGSVDLSTVNGSVEAYFDSLASQQSLEVESVNGSIDLYLPSGIDADVEASTVHGRIRNDFGLEVDSSGFVGSDLKGRIGGGGARISLENVNGSIEIHQN